MEESLRPHDTAAEKNLAEFMDRCFYSKLHDKEGKKILFERKTDRKSQLQGIDIELKVGNRSFLIDEKASFYYSNVMIPTFAFEIDSIQMGHIEPVEGWFVNDNLRTKFYMLIWPNVKCVKENTTWVRKDIKSLKSDDFTIVEAMLIDKDRLRREIEQRGCSKQYLIEYARRLRQQMQNGKEDKSEKVAEGIKIRYSGKIAEKPINAVIQKSVLRSIASATYLIAEDGYAQI